MGVWSKLAMAVCLVATLSATTYAQRGGGGGGFGGRGGGFGGRGGGGSTGFIMQSAVQKELGISEDDAEKLKSITEDAQQELSDLRQEVFGSFRDMSPEEREDATKEMAEKSAEIEKKARKAVTAKLSDAKKKRYAELEFQYQLQQGNLAGALAAADVDVDSEKLSDAMSEARDEIRKRTAEITREVYAKTLGDISDADVEKLMGKEFTFESTRPQFGGRGGGATGGRGGGGTAGGRGGRQRGGGDNARPARPSDEDEDTEQNTRRRR